MRLGTVLKKYRMNREITIRDMAKEIGISYPTYCRIEHGQDIDASTFMKILAWLTTAESAA